MTRSGFVVSAGGGRPVTGAGGSLLASAADTGDAFSLLLSHAPTGDHVPRHVHDAVDEAFYILDGQYRIYCGEQEWLAAAGDFAQWFRNIRANPQVRVWLGSRKPAPAIAHRLDAGAAAASLGRYAAAHPRSWAKLRPVLEDTLGTRITEHGAELPMIVLALVDQGPGRATARPGSGR